MVKRYSAPDRALEVCEVRPHRLLARYRPSWLATLLPCCCPFVQFLHTDHDGCRTAPHVCQPGSGARRLHRSTACAARRPRDPPRRPRRCAVCSSSWTRATPRHGGGTTWRASSTRVRRGGPPRQAAVLIGQDRPEREPPGETIPPPAARAPGVQAGWPFEKSTRSCRPSTGG